VKYKPENDNNKNTKNIMLYHRLNLKVNVLEIFIILLLS